MVGDAGPDAGLRIDVTTLSEDAIRLAADDIRSYPTTIGRGSRIAFPGPSSTG